eukprot:CAMPEP_0201661640 /NCGR_PEP_ID=MMETSP0494-20130426/3942_1 /ASSEMBLY_ACC=CAM_ASM_000839 /TAXON_ID=420259 /ORGANISM="Thalassiosira gravida, Strain GMp14c1" /LENGTH=1605 /DNA_ID=CAMNT_0048139801 /DNA_START=141 /DNA_END=4958 /DNA_ORIENTATION=+
MSYNTKSNNRGAAAPPEEVLTPEEQEQVAKLPKSTFSTFLSPAERKRRQKQKAEEAQKKKEEEAARLQRLQQQDTPPVSPIPEASKEEDDARSTASSELDEEEKKKAEAIAKTSYVSPAERKRRQLQRQKELALKRKQQAEAASDAIGGGNAEDAAKAATPSVSPSCVEGSATAFSNELQNRALRRTAPSPPVPDLTQQQQTAATATTSTPQDAVVDNNNPEESIPPSSNNNISPADRERQKRAAIQKVMKDTTLSPVERNQAIQKIIKGDFGAQTAAKVIAPEVTAPSDQTEVKAAVSPDDREKQKRAAIQKVRKDTTLSPVDRNAAIQKIIKGDFEVVSASKSTRSSRRSSKKKEDVPQMDSSSGESEGEESSSSSGKYETDSQEGESGEDGDEWLSSSSYESGSSYETETTEEAVAREALESAQRVLKASSQAGEITIDSSAGGEPTATTTSAVSSTQAQAPSKSTHSVIAASSSPLAQQERVKELEAQLDQELQNHAELEKAQQERLTSELTAEAQSEKEAQLDLEVQLDVELQNHAELEREQHEREIEFQRRAENSTPPVFALSTPPVLLTPSSEGYDYVLTPRAMALEEKEKARVLAKDLEVLAARRSDEEEEVRKRESTFAMREEQRRAAENEQERVLEVARTLAWEREEQHRMAEDEQERVLEVARSMAKDEDERRAAAEEEERLRTVLREDRARKSKFEAERRRAAEEREVEKRRLQALRDEMAREQAQVLQARSVARDKEKRRAEDKQRRQLKEEREKKARLEAEERKLRLEVEQRRATEERDRERERLRVLREETDREAAMLEAEKEQLRASEEREQERLRLQALREETEREQRRITALREERERQEEQRHIQEQQRLLQEERAQEHQRLRALREERERQQRVAQEQQRLLQEEQRRLQQEREREERAQEQHRLQEQQRLQEQRDLHQRLERERRQRLLEEQQAQAQRLQQPVRRQHQHQAVSPHRQREQQQQQVEVARVVAPAPRASSSSGSRRASATLASRQEHLNAGNPSSASQSGRLDDSRYTPYGNSSRSSNSHQPAPPIRPNSRYDGLEDDELNWRLDSYASLSDYTIVVNRARPGPHAPDFDTSDISSIEFIGANSSSGGGVMPKSDVYYVHKAMIAVGSRRSELLGRRIREAENTSRGGVPDGHSSEVNVHETVMLESAADAMGIVLDFCYYPDRALDINVENAVALVYLGQRYKIRALLEQAETFVMENLESATAMHFLLDSYLYKLNDVCARAIDVTAANLAETVNFVPIYRLPPELFRRIILSKELKCDSELLSLIVFSYCGEHHAEDIEVEYFRELTKPRIMSDIDPKVALMMLKFYVDLILDDDENCEIMEVLRGDSLMNRCVKVVSKKWEGEVCEPLIIDAEWDDPTSPASRRRSLPQHAEPTALHRSLPPTLQNYILEKCILEAKHDIDAEKSIVKNYEGKKKSEIESNAKNFGQVVKQLQGELEKSKRAQGRDSQNYLSQIQQLQQTAAELQARLDEKEKSVEEYKQELKQFRRVPGIHNFGEVAKDSGGANIIDKTKCTFSANPDHQTNHRRGNQRPTEMPSKGTELDNLGKENGYLYDDGKGGMLPVFYYQKRGSF